MPGPMDAMMMGGGPGGPPGMPGMPPMGAPTDPTAQMGLSALDALKSPNPTAAMQEVDNALQLSYRLIQKVIPQILQWNPKIAKDLHDVSRRLVSSQMDLRKDQPSFGPPPEMGMMDSAGLPPAGQPGMPL